MEKIIPYIENLLVQNDYVIIPELGGFVVQMQSAKITSTGIIPPFSTVSFNARMNNNDGLLATEILRSKNVNYREANKIIETEVGKIKNELYQGHKIKIGKFGYLHQNKEQQVIFSSLKKHKFLPANFGLKTINITKRDESQVRKLTITLSSKSAFRYAAVILILLGMFFISPKIGDSEISSDYAGINNPLALFESTTTIIKKAEEPVETISQQIDQPKVYHVIVSCLSNKRSAELYCELLRAKYYDNVHILPTAKTNRIVIESFSDKEIAILYMKKIRRENKEFADAWLHHEVSEN